MLYIVSLTPDSVNGEGDWICTSCIVSKKLRLPELDCMGFVACEFVTERECLCVYMQCVCVCGCILLILLDNK